MTVAEDPILNKELVSCVASLTMSLQENVEKHPRLLLSLCSLSSMSRCVGFCRTGKWSLKRGPGWVRAGAGGR